MMASPAGSKSQEYWRPSNPEIARVIPSIRDICWSCGADYTPGARFCHICGGTRDGLHPEPVRPVEKRTAEENAVSLVRTLGLSIPCAVFLIMGLAFALTALLSGVVYREDTLVDWQAVQTWRIEWLLASAVALLAGILLKRPRV
jgi:hypothetical protein